LKHFPTVPCSLCASVVQRKTEGFENGKVQLQSLKTSPQAAQVQNICRGPHQLLKDRKKNARKRSSQGEHFSSSATAFPNQNKSSGSDTRAVKIIVVGSHNIQKKPYKEKHLWHDAIHT